MVSRLSAAMAEFLVVAEVRLWGERVGAVAEDARGRIVFEYTPDFRRSGLEISPRTLPLSRSGPIEFPALRQLDAFHGLPGVLADSLPDRFGNAVITRYFESQGRPADALSPVQRLLYIGKRAMGALEFEPALSAPSPAANEALDVAHLVDEARRIVSGRTDIAVAEIMQVGGSAGGARPKAVMLWNPARDQVRSGFAPMEPGDESWLIKFDGVGEMERPNPHSQPFNRIEYAYHAMAREAGIVVPEARLLEERGLAHFMSRRFDRNGESRLHLHSLAGMEHSDFNNPASYSYEQYLRLVLTLAMPPAATIEAFRRAVFNIVAVNQDDHTKNLSFLMDRAGTRSLSPAYDLTFAHGSGFTRQHQMTLNGKTADFVRADLLSLGARFGLKQDGAPVIERVIDAVSDWPRHAAAAGVAAEQLTAIGAQHRTALR